MLLERMIVHLLQDLYKIVNPLAAYVEQWHDWKKNDSKDRKPYGYHGYNISFIYLRFF
jgi:hypothetical protein